MTIIRIPGKSERLEFYSQLIDKLFNELKRSPIGEVNQTINRMISLIYEMISDAMSEGIEMGKQLDKK